MATFKEFKEAYLPDPIVSIVSESLIDNDYLEFEVLKDIDDKSIAHRFRHWQTLEDRDDLSLKLVGDRIKGHTRGFAVKPRKLKSSSRSFIGVKKKKKIWSVLGVFFGTHNFCPSFFEAKRPKKRSKSDQKQNLSLVFFPSSDVGFCAIDASSMKETLQISFDFCFSNTHKRRKKGPPRDRRATDAAASKRAPMYSRYISAFDARV